MMPECAGLLAGIPVLACISEQTNYVLGYVLLVLLAAVLFYSLARELTHERMAAIMLVLAIVTAIGTVEQMLFPSHFFIVAATLFVGSVGMLFWRQGF